MNNKRVLKPLNLALAEIRAARPDATVTFGVPLHKEWKYLREVTAGTRPS